MARIFGLASAVLMRNAVVKSNIKKAECYRIHSTLLHKAEKFEARRIRNEDLMAKGEVHGRSTFFFFYISTKNLQYILLNNTTYKLLYPTTTTIPFGAKTTSTSWLQITGNTNIALHVTTRKTKIAQELHVTNCTGKKRETFT